MARRRKAWQRRLARTWAFVRRFIPEFLQRDVLLIARHWSEFVGWLFANLGGVLLWYLVQLVKNQLRGTSIAEPTFDLYITTAALALLTSAFSLWVLDRQASRREGVLLTFFAMLAAMVIVALFTGYHLEPVPPDRLVRTARWTMVGSLVLASHMFLLMKVQTDGDDPQQSSLKAAAHKPEPPIQVDADLPKVDSGVPAASTAPEVEQ